MRAHYYRPIQDSAGNLLPNVQVTVYDPGTTDLITDTIYSDDTGGNTVSNPFVTATGIIDLYLDIPRRIKIVTVHGTDPASSIEDQDVLSAGSDSPHVGAGSNSTQVGVGGSSPGSNSSSYGYEALTAGSQATALGSASTASGNQGTAVGAGSQANGVGSTVVGNSTSAGGAGSTALGNNAHAGTDTHSTAIGADAATDDDNQIMVGTPEDTAVFPGGVTLTAPGGARFALTVGTDGTLTTTAL